VTLFTKAECMLCDEAVEVLRTSGVVCTLEKATLALPTLWEGRVLT
jgi:hypothetical protein